MSDKINIGKLLVKHGATKQMGGFFIPSANLEAFIDACMAAKVSQVKPVGFIDESDDGIFGDVQSGIAEGLCKCGDELYVVPPNQTIEIENVRNIYNAVIQHALSLGFEADAFLHCWNEGDWEGCAEFGFNCDDNGK